MNRIAHNNATVIDQEVSNVMLVQYSTKFVSSFRSIKKSTNWELIDTLTKQTCEPVILSRIMQDGVYIYYTNANNGRFLHKYELVNIDES